jgi:polysaccharide export outer membrane protein
MKIKLHTPACMIVAMLPMIAICACSRTDQRIPDAFPAEPHDIYQPFVGGTGLPEQLIERPPYRLCCGDVIEIIYQVKNVISDKPYELKIEDVINIEFPYQQQFDQERTVSADGNIRVKLLGEVRAAGQTARDLEDYLRHGYAKYIRDPEITVAVKAANVKITELKKAITTAPRGQSRLVPVKPDGTIDLPYVGEVLVAGKTVREAKRLLDRLYTENDLQEVEVTVQTLEFAPRRIYVMGEVPSPGLIESQAPITLIQALTRLGGVTTRADKRNILLVRRQYLPIPEAVIFDLDAILSGKIAAHDGKNPDGSAFQYDMYLADGDYVYVPPSGLAQATDWIDMVFTRGIRSVFPYSGNVGLNFGYEIRQAPTTVKTRQIGPPSINSQIGP